MSIESLPPEMLMKVFSFVTDIRYKLRLQRVNKQWLTCIKSPQSWALNTRLFIKMGPTNPVFNPSKRRQGNIALVEYAPKITSLRFHGTNEDPDFGEGFLDKLWANEHKLQLEHLEIVYGAVSDGEPCRSEYSDFLARLMSHSTVRSIECFCCLSNNCELRETFAQQLRSCSGLQKLRWFSLPLAARGTVSTALKDLPIESLELDIEGDYDWLATVVNGTKNNSLHELQIADDLENYSNRELKGFLKYLSPSAAASIQVLKLTNGVCDLFDFLSTLPTIFPNLTKLEAFYSRPSNPTRPMALDVAEVIGDFIHSASNRDVPLYVRLNITSIGKVLFSRRLWSAVGLLSACKSGTKRATGEKRWKRTLEESNIKVCVENDWAIDMD